MNDVDARPGCAGDLREATRAPGKRSDSDARAGTGGVDEGRAAAGEARTGAGALREGAVPLRQMLLDKVAAFAPSLSPVEDARLARRACDSLMMLVAAAAAHVRDTLGDLANALPDPARSLIERRADTDPDAIIAPLLCLAPLLNRQDFHALLSGLSRAGPTPRAAVSAACGGGVDDPAIGDPCPTVRERALDAAFGLERRGSRGPVCADEPAQAELSEATRRLLDLIVADRLASVLQGGDLQCDDMLDPALVERLHRQLIARLGVQERASRHDPAGAAGTAAHAGGGLMEAAIASAVRDGDAAQAIALLAAAADVSEGAVRTMARLRSAKGAISLLWKAGLPMALAAPVQELLCGLAPSAMLRAGPGGEVPLGADEMLWQVDFLTQAALRCPPAGVLG